MQARFEWQRSKKGKTKNNNNKSDIEITSSYFTFADSWRTTISSQGTGICHRKPISWILLGNQFHHRFIYSYGAIRIHDILDGKKQRVRKKRRVRLLQDLNLRGNLPIHFECITLTTRSNSRLKIGVLLRWFFEKLLL